MEVTKIVLWVTVSRKVNSTERYENRTRVTTLEGWYDNHYTNRPGWNCCSIVTWWTGLINCQFWRLRSGEHITYHWTYVQVYGYRDPVVWPWFSCVWVTLAFSQGPNSDNIPLYIHYTRFRGTGRPRADLRTWSHETNTLCTVLFQYDHMTQNIGLII